MPLWATLNFGISPVILLLTAALGVLGGAIGGAQLGFMLGTKVVGAEFGELINTIFYQDEQQALSQVAGNLATSIESVDVRATSSF